jgi:hypothetical protein
MTWWTFFLLFDSVSDTCMKKKNSLFRLLLILTVSLVLTACKQTTWVRYYKGLKETETFTRFPKKSTSYTKRGKIIYTDSLTGQLVKVKKYREKVHCFGGSHRKNIEITYDSTGKRIERKNLLRISREKRREQTIEEKF